MPSTENEIQVQITELELLVVSALTRHRVPEEHAQIISDSIIYAHQRGKGTHGLGRIPIYINKIKSGYMDPETTIAFIKDSPVVSVLDANHGFGQVAAHMGMQLAADKARQYGVGVVGVRHSNSFGTAGWVAELASRRGLIGIVMANASPAISSGNGTRPVFGTNPLGVSFPVPEGHSPIVLDMAMSVAARSKIRAAAKNGEKIPMGWALDQEGQPTDDPNKALKGSLIPIAEHKGFGLAMVIDILAGMLPGAAFGGEVIGLNTQVAHSNYGHLFIAMNIEHFMSKTEYAHKITHLISKVKTSGLEQEFVLPGERSHKEFLNNREFLWLKKNLLEELQKIPL